MPYTKTMVLKVIVLQNYLKGLLKQTSGHDSQSFWFSSAAVGARTFISLSGGFVTSTGKAFFEQLYSLSSCESQLHMI